MADKFTGSDIVRLIIFFTVIVIGLIVFFSLKARIKHSAKEREKDKALLDELKIDTIRVDSFSRLDAHTWFDGFLKKDQRGMLMTAAALKARDKDIKLPTVAPGNTLIYLAIFSPSTGRTVRQRFIAAKHIEPELAGLIAQNDGSVVFEL